MKPYIYVKPNEPFIENTQTYKPKTVTCCQCREETTLDEIKSDRMRFYKTKLGILCELCFEDYNER